MRLVADANVLLSAVIGGRAHVVLSHPSVSEVLTVPSVVDEFREYLGHLARKKRLRVDALLMVLATLPVTVVGSEEYEGSRAKAVERIGHRDPDDVELLALAIHLGLPVWSNDGDFSDVGIEWYTTANLLKRLGVG